MQRQQEPLKTSINDEDNSYENPNPYVSQTSIQEQVYSQEENQVLEAND